MINCQGLALLQSFLQTVGEGCAADEAGELLNTDLICFWSELEHPGEKYRLPLQSLYLGQYMSLKHIINAIFMNEGGRRDWLRGFCITSHLISARVSISDMGAQNQKRKTNGSQHLFFINSNTDLIING